MVSQSSEPDRNLVALGRSIRRLRMEHGWSQEMLAERTGLSTNYVSDVERGTRNLGAKALFALADGLEVKLSRLVEFDEE